MTDTAVASTGSTILTQGIPPSAPAAEAVNGTPAQQPSNGIAEAMAAAERPEWAPEKYWDPEKKSLRTEDLAKGYTNLEKMLGRDKVPVPVSDDDAEGWDRWYAASGRPGKLEEYEFQRPDKLPDGLGYDDDLEKDFRATAFSMGLNKKQANGLYEKFVASQISRFEAYNVSQQQAKAQVETDLRRQLGNKYDAALQKANVAIAQYADPEFKQYLDQTGLGNDPRMIRAFIKIGEQMTGDTRALGKPEPAMNGADMERTIREYESKHTKALFDKHHPEHAMRVKERAKLYEAAFGDA